MLRERLHLIWLVVFIALCCVRGTKSVAQSETKYSCWGGAGLGVSAMQNLQGVAFGGSGRIAFGWSNSVVSLSAGGGGTTNVFGTNDNITIVNVSYGRTAFLKSWMFRLSAGPAYVNRVRRTSSLFSGTSTQFDISEVGAYAEAEGMFRYKLLGLSIVLSGAVTENTSALVATFNASLGSWER